MSREQYQFAFDFSEEPEKAPEPQLPATSQDSGITAQSAGIQDIGFEPDPHSEEALPLPPEEALFEISFDPSESTDNLSIHTEPAIQPKGRRGRKSQKDMAEELDRVQVPSDEELMQKQYYGIREVSEMFGVNSSLLRYWEGAFQLKLRKNRKGDRFFTPQDIKTLQLIHDLLRRRKLTIEGARDFLKKAKGVDERFALIQSLQQVRKFLLEVKAHL